MTKEEAHRITRLEVRERPEAKMDYLKCQLGKTSFTTVQTSAFRSLSVPVFNLVAFGSSWEGAVEMWERNKKKEQSAI